MIKNKSKPLSILLSGFLWVSFAHAQQSANATGGDASGSGGTAAYSVGQIVYTTNTATTGSVAQGVQQPYEISIVSGIDNPTVNIELSAYPNPTTDYIKLKVEGEKFEDLNYTLVDITGKLIASEKITSSTEIIGMENLASACYLLRVTNNNKELKTFKIIKN
jgi:hypothetical protein